MRFYLFIFAIALSVAGCHRPVGFRADKLERVDRQLVPVHCKQIDAVLGELFGTPDAPQVPDAVRGLIDFDAVKQAAGPVVSHTPGVTQGLYRRHCARCHGVTGDGYGPAALYQNPYPRDFRRGIIKFKSTPRGVPPTDEDLHEVLMRGVPGTAMPSFKLLAEAERHALVEYVTYLALRGQMEQTLVNYAAMELDFDPATGTAEEGSQLSLEDPVDRELVFEELLPEVVERWKSRDAKVASFEPANDPPEASGHELFADAKRANCAQCHGAEGAGGVRLKDMDDWNKRRSEFLGKTRRLATGAKKMSGERRQEALHEIQLREQVGASLLPPRTAQARRLLGGLLHGGRRAEDLFRAVQLGIDGTPMPGVGNTLSDAEIWALVGFVADGVENVEADVAE